MASLKDSCVGHWKMNDNAATATVVDSLDDHNGTYKDGTGNILTSTGASTGKVGGALAFDGDEYVEVPDHADFSFGNGTSDSPFSVSALIYLTDATSIGIISKAAAANYEWNLYMSGASLLEFYLFKLDNTAHRGRRYTTALSTEQWYHIVATYDGTGGASAYDGIKIYVDGTRKDNQNITNGTYAAMTDGTAPVHIGRYLAAYLGGKIDNVMIFNKALTQEEVTFLYNGDFGTELMDFPQYRIPENWSW